jgi:hypothetical protein
MENLMKPFVFFGMVLILAGRTAAAYGGPYAIEEDHIVRIGPWYQSATPIPNGPHPVCAIEFSRDGALYGVNPYADALVKIDPTTGDMETVGPLGVDAPWPTFLDEDDDGQLWMLITDSATQLYTIDRSTGAATLFCEPDSPYLGGLASIGGQRFTSSDYPSPPDPGCGIEYIRDDTYFNSLDVGPDGWIWSLSCTAIGQWWSLCIFSRHDPVTGTSEEVGRFEFGPWYSSLTFDPNDQPAPSIPGLRPPGAVALALLLTAAGTWMLLRRS